MTGRPPTEGRGRPGRQPVGARPADAATGVGERLARWRTERRERRALDLARRPLTRSVVTDQPAATTSTAGSSGPPPTSHQSSSVLSAPTRSIRRRVAFGAVASLLVLAGLAFLGPFPVRTWWAQRQRTQELQRQISVVEKANDELANRSKALNDPANIERLARRDYGMVRDGERAYALLPPPKVPVTLPPVWPFVTVSPRGPTTGQPAPGP